MTTQETSLQAIITQQEMQNERLQLIIERIKEGDTPVNASIKDLESQLRLNIELTNRLTKH